MALRVQWSQAGAAPQTVLLMEEMPVKDFLAEVIEVDKGGFEVLVNGGQVEMDDLIEEGDVITLNPKKSYNG